MTLDLLTGPTSGVDCTLAVLPVQPGLFYQFTDPFVSEVSGKLAIGEGIRQVPVTVRMRILGEIATKETAHTQEHPWTLSLMPHSGSHLGR